jgi:phenylalanyl-tRNA synthetase beta chain
VRVPLSWLRELVDWQGDAADLAEALTGRGVAVEAVERPGAGVAGIVAARIKAVEPLPGSDHLMVCRLDAGARGTATVLSGAPNIARDMLVPWAAPGSRLPGGRELAAQVMHGVTSEGMACSADEIGLPGEHADGLLALPEDLQPGQDLVDALELDDPVLVLELTPNYAAHCQSILGVAREVAAMTGAALRLPPEPAPPDAHLDATYVASVKISAPDLCGRFISLQLAGLASRPAPIRIQRRLQAAGMRPRDAIVDATNYVMLEVGQPLHAYDLRDLRGGVIGARRAAPGEVVITLDGQRRTLTADDLVIADGERAVGVAGIMGGENTEVHADTREVLLEAAYFQPAGIARTARRLGLASAASARFARGVDPARVRWAADRCAELIAAWAGGGLSAEPVDVTTASFPEAGPVVRLRASLVRGLLGVKITAADCGGHLTALGFGVSADGADRLRVVVPTWRADVAAEIDLVEEVARAYGYDRIPEVLPEGAAGTPLPDPVGDAGEAAGAVARAAGYSEAVTTPLQAESEWERLRLPPGHELRRALLVQNPMTEDQRVLRRLLLPGLLAALGYNARHRRLDAALYERGRVFLPAPGAELPDEHRRFALAAAGAGAGFLACKGVLEVALERLGLDGVRWERAAPEDLPFLHPGRSAWAVAADGVRLGYVGEIHPETASAYGVAGVVAGAEVDLGLVAARRPAVTRFLPWLRAPAVRRDLALVLPEAVPAAEVAAVMREAGGDLLREVRLFDVYTGEGIEPGQRSLAYTLVYQADRTLTDAEVDRAHDTVREALAVQLGAQLRS